MSVAAFEGIANSPYKPAASGPSIAAVVPANGRRAAPQMRPAATHPEASRALVLSVIKRIESYLEEETTALQTSLDFDFKASNDRKSQGLVDLNQALRRLPKSDLDADLKARLEVFRKKLAANLKIIRLHLDAVKEIASILSDAIQDAESDGTYTRSIGPYRSAP